jgi:hypothetical protein
VEKKEENDQAEVNLVNKKYFGRAQATVHFIYGFDRKSDGLKSWARERLTAELKEFMEDFKSYMEDKAEAATGRKVVGAYGVQAVKPEKVLSDEEILMVAVCFAVRYYNPRYWISQEIVSTVAKRTGLRNRAGNLVNEQNMLYMIKRSAYLRNFLFERKVLRYLW